MRRWVFRVMRLIAVGFAAWIAYSWLAPQGRGWIVLAVAGGIGVGWIGWRTIARIRAKARVEREDRWGDALLSAPHRPAALREIRRELERERNARRRAELTLVLAELLEADSEPAKAREALDALDLKGQPESLRAIVRHARAVASLSAGDVDAAERALDEDSAATGNRHVDLKIRLLRAAILIERGQAERALEIADEAKSEADDELKLEVKVVRALAIDAMGDKADALKILRSLGADMLELLCVLGLPRVRALAAEARDED